MGKGYKYAQQDKVGKWHGVSPFDVATGKSLSLLPPNEISWSQVISNTVMDLAEKDKIDCCDYTSHGSREVSY